MLAAFIASLLLTTTTVSAHGFTRGFRVEGSAFDNGPDPGVDTPHGPIRQVTTADPVTDVTSDDIVCGPGASDLGAPRSYPIENGAKMFFTWAGKTKDLPWEHEFGPILTYLASCNGRCNGFDATKAEWYKIDELGQKNGGKSNEWFQADIRRNPEVTVSLPNNIPDGEYLLRHEIIVLNSAGKPGGAQFYPSCTQIKVQGAPTNAGLPPKFRSVSFPGAYKADDAGILVPDVRLPISSKETISNI
ncbi:hypothetical protein FRC03_001256 [Tulasnella sp. 419]|nr:hypothetical protein FRC03_001256 [Tulasnella sp. 419]